MRAQRPRARAPGALLCGGRPWYYARPAAAPRSRRSASPHLKSRSLGAVFADPTMQRGRTEIVRLRPADDLYTLAAQTLDAPPAEDLRSAHGVPPARQAAVGERVFLPGIGAFPSPGLTQRLRQYALLMRLHRPIGILLLLWPNALGPPVVRGAGSFELARGGGVRARRGADALRRLCHQRLRRPQPDPPSSAHARTAIAAGRVNPREALALFAALCLIAFALVLTLNRFTILLSLSARFWRDLSVSQTLDAPAAVLSRHWPSVEIIPWQLRRAQTGAVPWLA